ncbi:polycystin-2-like [Biomphalaria glabrata]|uniref:Polycystin-2-like n=1 Tax=Biomphalaria glabrata TaxID=6526 RepID=A0A9W2ZI88_BIOGL|nr:polycystin-2-like [Biomphalaria glabrata]XP_055874647.1 polycystin-2-like [Biomphalaria glabrata]XP_055874648.1 polycystin-2-like [Biomphalaria glabrata]XP_055874649.1 polycystin-2-like [Biomphalaria glabrata]XP_055874650.1 polycystin-2-like [Biomphalaria glabrata]KAI8767113.1 polycystic kidney disease 2-like 1 protein [Biomphalaria glabrata]
MSNRPASAQSRTAWDTGYGDSIHNDTDEAYMAPTRSAKSSTSQMVTSAADLKKSGGAGAFQSFLKGIRSLWATRQTEETNTNRELYVKTTLRELIVYIVFLVILCVITFGMTSTTMYYFTNVMQGLFLETPWNDSNQDGNFQNLGSVEDFWDFAKGPLLDSLYMETNYNNESLPEDELGYIYYENKLLGVPRIRQLRVHNNSCKVHEDFQSFISECYDSYAESIEDKEPFGEYLSEKNSTAWRYFTEDELHGSSHWGMLNTYSGAGSYVDLGTRKDPSTDIITHLFDKLWIRRGTRAVFIDFTVYNANINLFCVVRLLAEFPATGGVIPSWTFRTVKLIRYVSVGDYFILACEVIFCLFILYYMVEEILEIKKHKLSYFKSFWNILDIVVIIISIVCIGFNIYRTLEVNDKLTALLKNPDVYSDFERLSYWETRFSNAIAIAVFMAWIKIFKYISFNKTMTQLSSTLGRCAKDLAGFFVMFIIIFLAFTQLGYLLFGTQVEDFSSFENSFFCLFRIILGDFDFHQLEQANRILGPIFFMLFVFFVFFVLINMFLAIINDTYSEVKSDMANAKNEFEIADYFKKGYEKMLDKLNFKRDKIVDIQKALRTADINQDKQLDFDEWRQDLKSRGYADGEIEAMFSKYDCDGDRVLDEEEQKRMQADLADQKAALNKEYEDLNGKGDRPGTGRRSSSRASFNEGDSGDDSDDEDSGTKSSRTGRTSNGVSYEEFTVLSRRVDRMEHSIGSIVSKIDAVLVKLEAMEKAKLKRRETMGKILDSITESDGTSDEVKREQMEKLVREELERWDSETSVGVHSARGASPGGGSGQSGLRPRSRAESGDPKDNHMTSSL